MSDTIPKYMRNRFTEIQEKCAPVLNELGLAKILVGRSRRHTGYQVYFESEEPRGPSDVFSFSPVSVIFADERSTDLQEADWRRCAVAIEDWRAKPLGTTGWSHQRCWKENILGVDSKGEKLFTWLNGRIRTKGVVHVDPLSPNIVQSRILADAFWEIGRSVRDIAIVRYPGKSEELEALTFLGYDGKRVHMQFPRGESYAGTLYIDGEEIGGFHLRSAEQVAYLAENLSNGQREIERNLVQR